MRSVCLLLIGTFVVQDLAWAAPEIRLSFPSSPTHPSGLSIPHSVASIEESFKAETGRTVYLLQDAHTNFSAQKNIASAIRHLIDKEGIRTVYVEGGFGDVSLTEMKKAGARVRESTGMRYLRSGELSGAEFLNLTSEKDFVLQGVEEEALYWKSLERYRGVAARREELTAYLSNMQRSVDKLKPELLHPLLRGFDRKRQGFLDGKLSFGEYFSALKKYADWMGVPLAGHPELEKLAVLGEFEKRIDFKAANEEAARSARFIEERSPGALAAKSEAGKLNAKNSQTTGAFYALLEEKLKEFGASAYPNLSRYFDYLKKAETLKPADILRQQQALEKSLSDALIETEDERTLLAIGDQLRQWAALLSLSILPNEFESLVSEKSYTLNELTGFVNQKIMDLEDHYDRVLFLDEAFEKSLGTAQEFYDLTRERDKAFVEKMLASMAEKGETKAVLLAGGYHSPNLKSILKAKDISYVSVTPQILNETNITRYEKLLLSQKPSVAAGKADQIPLLAVGNRPAGTDILNGARLAQELTGADTVTLASRIAEKEADVPPRALYDDYWQDTRNFLHRAIQVFVDGLPIDTQEQRLDEIRIPAKAKVNLMSRGYGSPSIGTRLDEDARSRVVEDLRRDLEPAGYGVEIELKGRLTGWIYAALPILGSLALLALLAHAFLHTDFSDIPEQIKTFKQQLTDPNSYRIGGMPHSGARLAGQKLNVFTRTSLAITAWAFKNPAWAINDPERIFTLKDIVNEAGLKYWNVRHPLARLTRHHSEKLDLYGIFEKVDHGQPMRFRLSAWVKELLSNAFLREKLLSHLERMIRTRDAWEWHDSIKDFYDEAEKRPDFPMPSVERIKQMYEGADTDGRIKNAAGREIGRISYFSGMPYLHERVEIWMTPYGPRGDVLVVGAGRGEFEAFLKERGYGVLGVELSGQNAAYARLRGLDIVEGDFNQMEDFGRQFDVVFFPESIGHMDLDQALKNASRHLKENGRVIILARFGRPGQDPLSHFDQSQYIDYSKETVEAALQRNGFDIGRTLNLLALEKVERTFSGINSLQVVEALRKPSSGARLAYSQGFDRSIVLEGEHYVFSIGPKKFRLLQSDFSPDDPYGTKNVDEGIGGRWEAIHDRYFAQYVLNAFNYVYIVLRHEGMPFEKSSVLRSRVQITGDFIRVFDNYGRYSTLYLENLEFESTIPAKSPQDKETILGIALAQFLFPFVLSDDLSLREEALDSVKTLSDFVDFLRSNAPRSGARLAAANGKNITLSRNDVELGVKFAQKFNAEVKRALHEGVKNGQLREVHIAIPGEIPDRFHGFLSNPNLFRFSAKEWEMIHMYFGSMDEPWIKGLPRGNDPNFIKTGYDFKNGRSDFDLTVLGLWNDSGTFSIPLFSPGHTFVVIPGENRRQKIYPAVIALEAAFKDKPHVDWLASLPALRWEQIKFPRKDGKMVSADIRWGDPGGTVVVLAQGVAGRGITWEKQMTDLPKSYTVVVPRRTLISDEAGVPISTQKSLKFYAEDLAASVRYFEGHHVELATHSFGCLVAFWLIGDPYKEYRDVRDAVQGWFFTHPFTTYTRPNAVKSVVDYLLSNEFRDGGPLQWIVHYVIRLLKEAFNIFPEGWWEMMQRTTKPPAFIVGLFRFLTQGPARFILNNIKGVLSVAAGKLMQEIDEARAASRIPAIFRAADIAEFDNTPPGEVVHELDIVHGHRTFVEELAVKRLRGRGEPEGNGIVEMKNVPVTLLAGKRDLLIDLDQARGLAKKMRANQFVILGGKNPKRSMGGHNTQLVHPYWIEWNKVMKEMVDFGPELAKNFFAESEDAILLPPPSQSSGARMAEASGHIPVVDENGTPTGRVISKHQIPFLGVHERIPVAHLMYLLPVAGNVLGFFQQRGESLDYFPGRWDWTASGFFEPGETGLQAVLRELGEESKKLLKPDPARIMPFGQLNSVLKSGLKVFRDVYLYYPDPEEIAFTDWMARNWKKIREVKGWAWKDIHEKNDFPSVRHVLEWPEFQKFISGLSGARMAEGPVIRRLFGGSKPTPDSADYTPKLARLHQEIYDNWFSDEQLRKLVEAASIEAEVLPAFITVEFSIKDEERASADRQVRLSIIEGQDGVLSLPIFPIENNPLGKHAAVFLRAVLGWIRSKASDAKVEFMLVSESALMTDEERAKKLAFFEKALGGHFTYNIRTNPRTRLAEAVRVDLTSQKRDRTRRSAPTPESGFGSVRSFLKKALSDKTTDRETMFKMMLASLRRIGMSKEEGSELSERIGAKNEIRAAVEKILERIRLTRISERPKSRILNVLKELDSDEGAELFTDWFLAARAGITIELFRKSKGDPEVRGALDAFYDSRIRRVLEKARSKAGKRPTAKKIARLAGLKWPLFEARMTENPTIKGEVDSVLKSAGARLAEPVYAEMAEVPKIISDFAGRNPRSKVVIRHIDNLPGDSAEFNVWSPADAQVFARQVEQHLKEMATGSLWYQETNDGNLLIRPSTAKRLINLGARLAGRKAPQTPWEAFWDGRKISQSVFYAGAGLVFAGYVMAFPWWDLAAFGNRAGLLGLGAMFLGLSGPVIGYGLNEKQGLNGSTVTFGALLLMCGTLVIRAGLTGARLASGQAQLSDSAARTSFLDFFRKNDHMLGVFRDLQRLKDDGEIAGYGITGSFSRDLYRLSESKDLDLAVIPKGTRPVWEVHEILGPIMRKYEPSIQITAMAFGPSYRFNEEKKKLEPHVVREPELVAARIRTNSLKGSRFIYLTNRNVTPEFLWKLHEAIEAEGHLTPEKIDAQFPGWNVSGARLAGQDGREFHEIRNRIGLSQEQFGIQLQPEHPIGKSHISEMENGSETVPMILMEKARLVAREGYGPRLKRIRLRLAVSEEAFGRLLLPEAPLTAASVAEMESGAIETSASVLDKALELAHFGYLELLAELPKATKLKGRLKEIGESAESVDLSDLSYFETRVGLYLERAVEQAAKDKKAVRRADGKRLKEIRAELEYPAPLFAEKLGIDEAALRAVESGKRAVGADVLERAEALHRNGFTAIRLRLGMSAEEFGAALRPEKPYFSTYISAVESGYQGRLLRADMMKAAKVLASRLYPQRMRSLRERSGLSEEEFGKVLRQVDPLSAETIRQIEAGVLPVPGDILDRAIEFAQLVKPSRKESRLGRKAPRGDVIEEGQSRDELAPALFPLAERALHSPRTPAMTAQLAYDTAPQETQADYSEIVSVLERFVLEEFPGRSDIVPSLLEALEDIAEDLEQRPALLKAFAGKHGLPEARLTALMDRLAAFLSEQGWEQPSPGAFQTPIARRRKVATRMRAYVREHGPDSLRGLGGTEAARRLGVPLPSLWNEKNNYPRDFNEYGILSKKKPVKRSMKIFRELMAQMSGEDLGLALTPEKKRFALDVYGKNTSWQSIAQKWGYEKYTSAFVAVMNLVSVLERYLEHKRAKEAYAAGGLEAILESPVSVLRISDRQVELLKKAGVHLIEDLHAQVTASELLEVPGLGEANVRDIKIAMQDFPELSLGAELPKPEAASRPVRPVRENMENTLRELLSRVQESLENILPPRDAELVADYLKAEGSDSKRATTIDITVSSLRYRLDLIMKALNRRFDYLEFMREWGELATAEDRAAFLERTSVERVWISDQRIYELSMAAARDAGIASIADLENAAELRTRSLTFRRLKAVWDSFAKNLPADDIMAMDKLPALKNAFTAADERLFERLAAEMDELETPSGLSGRDLAENFVSAPPELLRLWNAEGLSLEENAPSLLKAVEILQAKLRALGIEDGDPYLQAAMRNEKPLSRLFLFYTAAKILSDWVAPDRKAKKELMPSVAKAAAYSTRFPPLFVTMVKVVGYLKERIAVEELSVELKVQFLRLIYASAGRSKPGLDMLRSAVELFEETDIVWADLSEGLRSQLLTTVTTAIAKSKQEDLRLALELFGEWKTPNDELTEGQLTDVLTAIHQIMLYGGIEKVREALSKDKNAWLSGQLFTVKRSGDRSRYPDAMFAQAALERRTAEGLSNFASHLMSGPDADPDLLVAVEEFGIEIPRGKIRTYATRQSVVDEFARRKTADIRNTSEALRSGADKDEALYTASLRFDVPRESRSHYPDWASIQTAVDARTVNGWFSSAKELRYGDHPDMRLLRAAEKEGYPLPREKSGPNGSASRPATPPAWRPSPPSTTGSAAKPPATAQLEFVSRIKTLRDGITASHAAVKRSRRLTEVQRDALTKMREDSAAILSEPVFTDLSEETQAGLKGIEQIFGGIEIRAITPSECISELGRMKALFRGLEIVLSEGADPVLLRRRRLVQLVKHDGPPAGEKWTRAQLAKALNAKWGQIRHDVKVLLEQNKIGENDVELASGARLASFGKNARRALVSVALLLTPPMTMLISLDLMKMARFYPEASQINEFPGYDAEVLRALEIVKEDRRDIYDYLMQKETPIYFSPKAPNKGAGYTNFLFWPDPILLDDWVGLRENPRHLARVIVHEGTHARRLPADGLFSWILTKHLELNTAFEEAEAYKAQMFVGDSDFADLYQQLKKRRPILADLIVDVGIYMWAFFVYFWVGAGRIVLIMGSYWIGLKLREGYLRDRKEEDANEAEENPSGARLAENQLPEKWSQLKSLLEANRNQLKDLTLREVSELLSIKYSKLEYYFRRYDSIKNYGILRLSKILTPHKDAAEQTAIINRNLFRLKQQVTRGDLNYVSYGLLEKMTGLDEHELRWYRSLDYRLAHEIDEAVDDSILRAAALFTKNQNLIGQDRQQIWALVADETGMSASFVGERDFINPKVKQAFDAWQYGQKHKASGARLAKMRKFENIFLESFSEKIRSLRDSLGSTRVSEEQKETVINLDNDWMKIFPEGRIKFLPKKYHEKFQTIDDYFRVIKLRSVTPQQLFDALNDISEILASIEGKQTPEINDAEELSKLVKAAGDDIDRVLSSKGRRLVEDFLARGISLQAFAASKGKVYDNVKFHIEQDIITRLKEFQKHQARRDQLLLNGAEAVKRSPISELWFTTKEIPRALSQAHRSDTLMTIGELAAMKPTQLLKIRSIGARHLMEIARALRDFDLSLAPETSNGISVEHRRVVTQAGLANLLPPIEKDSRPVSKKKGIPGSVARPTNGNIRTSKKIREDRARILEILENAEAPLMLGEIQNLSGIPYSTLENDIHSSSKLSRHRNFRTRRSGPEHRSGENSGARLASPSVDEIRKFVTRFASAINPLPALAKFTLGSDAFALETTGARLTLRTEAAELFTLEDFRREAMEERAAGREGREEKIKEKRLSAALISDHGRLDGFFPRALGVDSAVFVGMDLSKIGIGEEDPAFDGTVEWMLDVLAARRGNYYLNLEHLSLSTVRRIRPFVDKRQKFAYFSESKPPQGTVLINLHFETGDVPEVLTPLEGEYVIRLKAFSSQRLAHLEPAVAIATEAARIYQNRAGRPQEEILNELGSSEIAKALPAFSNGRLKLTGAQLDAYFHGLLDEQETWVIQAFDLEIDLIRALQRARMTEISA